MPQFAILAHLIGVLIKMKQNKMHSKDNKLFLDSNLLQRTIRPIHYLGSKLRILDSIEKVINSIDSTGGAVCDLFAGSGTVSSYLAKTRSVSSVDIQEYSRVICSALLNPTSKYYEIDHFLDISQNSRHYYLLSWCIQPLIEYEADCVKKAISGNLIPLYELIEKGSIISFEQGYNSNYSLDLKEALKSTNYRLSKSNFLLGPEALIVRYFGGLYFSYQQAIQIDTLLEMIDNLDKNSKDSFLAAVLSTASEIVNTVGKQFAQPLKPMNSDGTPKKKLLDKILKDRSYDVFFVFQQWLEYYLSIEKTSFKHHVYRMDYSAALDIIKDVSVVYADPPYTRYHYSRYYHVLETICLRDNPVISKTYIHGKTKLSHAIYRNDRHQSPFSIKSQSSAAFDTLFKKVRNLDASLVLSYSPYDKTKKSTPRINTINDLVDMSKKYFAKTDVVPVGQFSHSKLNSSDNNFDISYDAELLIVCQV